MEQELFAHQSGEPVARVDPGDLRSVWQVMEESRLEAQVSGSELATGMDFLNSRCTPGVDLEAVSYRAMVLGLLSLSAPMNSELAPKMANWTTGYFKWPREYRWDGQGAARRGRACRSISTSSSASCRQQNDSTRVHFCLCRSWS